MSPKLLFTEPWRECVYRILLSCIVSSRYTHEQYSVYVKHEDCGKRDLEIEGKCDFVVIAPRFIAIIEVKAVDLKGENPDKAFKNNLRSSISQRKRTNKLIDHEIQKSLAIDSMIPIRDYSLFSEIERAEVIELPSFIELDSISKDFVLFEDDLQFLKDVLCCPVNESPSSGRYPDEIIRYILLGLWKSASNECELSQIIRTLDKQLKSSLVTRMLHKDGRPPTSLLKKAPFIFRKYLKIEYLTVDQHRIFASKSRKQWINGPAGCGKTILMMAKVIELAQDKTDHVPITIIAHGIFAARKLYQCLLLAKITGITLKSPSKDIGDMFTDYPNEGSYINIYCVKSGHTKYMPYRSVSALLTTELNSERHIFVDDLQSFGIDPAFEDSEPLLKLISDKLNCKEHTRQINDRFVWFGYDELQCGMGSYGEILRVSYKMKYLLENLKEFKMVSLPSNLRNTFEISCLLNDLRNKRLIMEREYIQKTQYNESQLISSECEEIFLKSLAVSQSEGHFIHGPCPVFHIIHGKTANTSLFVKAFKGIVKNEISRIVSLVATADKDTHEQKGSGLVFISDRSFQDHASATTRPIQWHSVSSGGFMRYNRTQGIPYKWPTTGYIDWSKEFRCVVDSLQIVNTDDVEFLNLDASFSVEYPAAIAVVDFNAEMWKFLENTRSTNSLSSRYDLFDQLMTKLYLAASRARVYSSVILVMRDITSFLGTYSQISHLSRKAARQIKPDHNMFDRSASVYLKDTCTNIIRETLQSHALVKVGSVDPPTMHLLSGLFSNYPPLLHPPTMYLFSGLISDNPPLIDPHIEPSIGDIMVMFGLIESRSLVILREKFFIRRIYMILSAKEFPSYLINEPTSESESESESVPRSGLIRSVLAWIWLYGYSLWEISWFQ